MKKNPQQIAKTKHLLAEAVVGVDDALKAWPQAPLPFSSEKELKFFSAKLQEMLRSIEAEGAVEIPGLWHIVTDTWPYTNKLRQKIVEAELAYERLK